MDHTFRYDMQLKKITWTTKVEKNWPTGYRCTACVWFFLFVLFHVFSLTDDWANTKNANQLQDNAKKMLEKPLFQEIGYLSFFFQLLNSFVLWIAILSPSLSLFLYCSLMRSIQWEHMKWTFLSKHFSLAKNHRSTDKCR